MIIVCCGMSRSASTLQYQLVKHIIEDRQLGRGIGFSLQKPEHADNEYIVVKAEKPHPWALDMVRNKTAFGVSVYRDPRDVAVSLHHFFHARHTYAPKRYRDWTQSQIIKEWLPRIIRWYRVWETVPHFQTDYESNYFLGWSQTLSIMFNDYLHIPLTLSDAEQTCIKFSLTNNINRQNAQEEWIDIGNTMLTKEHISPTHGFPGEYKHHLTPQQIERIEYENQEWMNTHGYPTGNNRTYK